MSPTATNPQSPQDLNQSLKAYSAGMSRRKPKPIHGLMSVTEDIDRDKGKLQYKVFVPNIVIPASYQTGWFKDVLQYQREAFDDVHCEEVLNGCEAIDWQHENEESENTFVSFHEKGDETVNCGPYHYLKFFDDAIKLVPLLHQRKPESIERVLVVARKAFFADPVFFMCNFSIFAEELLPRGMVAQCGKVDFDRGPIENLFVCYGLRVIKDRFPFCTVPINIRMVEYLENALLARTLEQHGKDCQSMGYYDVPKDVRVYNSWRIQKSKDSRVKKART